MARIDSSGSAGLAQGCRCALPLQGAGHIVAASHTACFLSGELDNGDGNRTEHTELEPYFGAERTEPKELNVIS